jgi:hypothetical protein
MQESWKTHPLHEFPVSTQGRVMIRDDIKTHGCRKADGYMYVSGYPVHRLVGETFMDSPNVYHIDNNPSNNSLGNLKVV